MEHQQVPMCMLPLKVEQVSPPNSISKILLAQTSDKTLVIPLRSEPTVWGP